MCRNKFLLQFSVGALLVITATLPALANSTTRNMDCNKKKYEKYLQVKKDWNTHLSNIITEEEPRFAEIAKELLLRETKLIEADWLEFEFLANKDPQELHLDRPLNQWVKLSDNEKKQLAATDKDYTSLTQFSWDHATAKSRSDRKQALSRIMVNRRFIAYIQVNKKRTEEVSGISCSKP